jgi:hypothetical protein
MATASSGGITGMIGSSVGEAAAFAAGLAIHPLLEPIVQAIKNETWSQYPDRPLDPDVAAQLVSENRTPEAVGANEAALSGMSAARFGELVETIRKAPGVAEARTLIRRRDPHTGASLITTDMLHHAYAKAQIEEQYWPALDAILDEPLPPAVAALAAVRGLISDEGFLPVSPPTEHGVIAPFPVYPISGLASAQAAGYSRDAYGVMVGINGRPMSLHEAASAYFRGIIERADYELAVAEGDTRNEWRDAILEQAREISTAHDAVENHLRGYSDAPTMYARASRHGMSTEDTNIIFQNAGRPLVAHQITTGLARGGVFHPEPNEQTDPYDAAVRESNVKPSYYDLWFANRYSYPSLFQLNALVKANAITADTAKDWAEKEGLAPEVVDALFTFWQGEQAKAGGATGTKPKTFTYSQIHQAWRHSVFTDAQAVTELEAIGYPAARAQTLLATWKATVAAGTATTTPGA